MTWTEVVGKPILASAFVVQGAFPNFERGKRLHLFNCDEITHIYYPSSAGGFYLRGGSYREEETPHS
jgi:hypothetical protein